MTLAASTMSLCLLAAVACPAQSSWRLIKAGGGPSTRFGNALVYDAARQRTVLFGGFDVTFQSDTWEWDGSSWSLLKPVTSPISRVADAITYDSDRGRIVMFGGWASPSVLDDTWEWDGRNWTQMNPTTSPSIRDKSAMAYDAVRRRCVLFGGMNATSLLQDTWEWDGRNWTKMAPANVPAPRAQHTLVYDAGLRRTVMFGGFSAAASALDETWQWDGVDWTRLNPPVSPPARANHSMVYDSARHLVVLFGGRDSASNGLDDTWELNGVSWTRNQAAGRLFVGRWTPDMAYDSERQRVVLWGTFPTMDTWEYGGGFLPLTADTLSIPIKTGGTQRLSLNAGTGMAGKSYWVFGSMTGTSPGVSLGGVTVPLNPDLYTTLAIGSVNTTVFTNFRGTLDGQGRGEARFNVPVGLPPLPFTLDHAFVAYDAQRWHLASNAVPVFLQ